MSDPKCPEAPDGGSHHWVPKRAGQEKFGGEPVYEMRCKYCGEPQYP